MSLFILICFCRLHSPAQKTDYLFKHITTANGLVSNTVLAIMQDQEGYIWIGTQTGLQRYDGKRFTTYLADVHNADALQSDWINAIFEDSKQRLWIGTNVSGACLLNRNTGKFYNFNLHLPAGAKRINGIWHFLEDRQGNIWLSAHDGYYLFNEKIQQFQPVNARLKMAANALPSSISMDNAGDLWFGTTMGIKQLAVKTNSLFDKNNNPGHKAIFDIEGLCSNINFDAVGNIWVSSTFERQLFRYNVNLNKLITYTFNKPGHEHSNLFTQKEFIGVPFICSNANLLVPLLSRGIGIYNYAADSFSIINISNNIPYGLHAQINGYSSLVIKEDKEKNIWIGSDEGLNISGLNTPAFTNYGIPKNNNADIIPPSEVSDFLQTSDGDIYISYYFANGGIKRYDQNFNFKQHYLYKTGDTDDAINNDLWCLFQDDKGIIWAPNQAGSIIKLNPATNSCTLYKDSILKGAINQIQLDTEKNIWIAHERKGLVRIDAVTKKITTYTNFCKPELSARKRVLCFLQDQDKIWVGTILNGLQLFDKKSGSFTRSFVMNEQNKQSISNNNITGILQYNKDTLIIATQGGINIFNKRKNTFTSILSKDGLPNNLTQAIMLDDKKNLWAAFATGLSKIKMPGLTITNYDEDDGIIDAEFSHNTLKLKDGRLMIAAFKSCLVFDPAKVTEYKLPANVTITGFKVFDKELMINDFVKNARPVILSHNENSLHIEFASLQFSVTKNIKYFYKLEGIDKGWMAADNDHSIHYNQLRPGKYIFKVKCANRDGAFSKKTTTLAIHIIPPFWQRWWFIALLCLLAAGGIYTVVKWREKNIRSLEAGKTKLQQLTAEKYKARFELEQISSFFTTSLLNKNNVDDVLWDVAKNLISKLGFVDCIMYLWNADKTILVQKAGYGPKGSIEAIESKRFEVLPGQGIVGTVAQTGEALIVPDTSADERYRVDDLVRLSEITVPIKYDEQLLGVIDCEHHEKNFFTTQHLQVLSTIATLVASKIKSIEAEQRLRHQKAELADMNQQLAEVQLAALRSQMNPHFIFNALNSIKKFVIANEPANAEKYLGKFSKLIRLILDNSHSAMVTVEREIQLLKLYLDLEQLRFGSKLTYSINVDEHIHAGDIEIPSMIVQPFVENAMLHGIMHKEDGGKVDVHFVLHNAWLEIIIDDNGVGRTKSAEYRSENAAPHHSIGIEVATKRLQALKKNINTPAGIRIVDLKDDAGIGTGTKVIIAIPLN